MASHPWQNNMLPFAPGTHYLRRIKWKGHILRYGVCSLPSKYCVRTLAGNGNSGLGVNVDDGGCL